MRIFTGIVPALAAVVAVAAVVGDGRAQDAFAPQIAEAVPRVEAALGLHFKRPVRYEVRDRAEMRRMLAKMLDAERSARELAAEQTVYHLLGIIPDTLDWPRLQLDLLAEQVVGFYDPRSKVLYLQNDPDDPTLSIVIPHELVHALQDQYMDLDSLVSLKGDDDRVLAAMAVMEGQATLVSFEIALGMGADFPGSEEAIRLSVRSGMEEQPVIAAAPHFVRELEIFPYLSGMEFMLRFQRERPGALPFGSDLPTSTAQIEHVALYFGPSRKEPLALSLPAPRGAELVYENDFGAFATRVFLEQLLRDRKRAARATAGWAGDRYALVRTASGDGLVWLTVCDTPRDAAEFAEAMRRASAKRYRDARSEAGRTVTVTRVEIAGRPAVLYEDLPPGTLSDVLDLALVRAH